MDVIVITDREAVFIFRRSDMFGKITGLWTGCTKFSHMIVLSALWVVCSLPVITIRACHDCPVLCSCKNNSLRDRLSDSRIFPLYERKLQTGCACKYREFVCISVLLWNLSVLLCHLDLQTALENCITFSSGWWERLSYLRIII